MLRVTYRWAMRVVLAILAFLVFALVLATAARAQAPTPRVTPRITPRQLAVPTAAVWGTSVYALGATRQWHHEYVGLLLVAMPDRRIQWVGLAIMVDDAMQHLVQTRHPRYESPLHRAYAVTLYRWTH